MKTLRAEKEQAKTRNKLIKQLEDTWPFLSSLVEMLGANLKKSTLAKQPNIPSTGCLFQNQYINMFYSEFQPTTTILDQDLLFGSTKEQKLSTIRRNAMIGPGKRWGSS